MAAMERLTSSQCVDYPIPSADCPLRRNARASRCANGSANLTALRRLEIAIQVARAVFDAHHQANVVRMDLQMKNVMMKNGMVHLNDFNLGHILNSARQRRKWLRTAHWRPFFIQIRGCRGIDFLRYNSSVSSTFLNSFLCI